MSIQLQVAIPLFVTFAALAAIAVWRKYFKLETLILCVVALSLGVYMTVLHTGANQETVSEFDGATDNAAVSLMLADQYMLERRYDEASDILQDLQKSDGDDSRILLASARCAVLQGSYATAVQLYQQSGADGIELEQAVLLMGLSQSGSNATAEYLEKQGIDPAVYGLAVSDLSHMDHDDAVELIREELRKDLDELEEAHGSDIMDAVKYAAKLTAGFRDYVSGSGDVDVDSSVRKLDSCISAIPGLAENAHIRIARLKGYVLTGAYGKIAKAADRNVTAEELVVISQLLVDGSIDEDDFTESFVNMDSDRYEQIVEICRNTLSKNEAEMSDELQEKYEEKLDLLKEQMKRLLSTE